MQINQIISALFLTIFLLISKAEAANSEWKNAIESNSVAKVRVLSSFYTNDKQQKNLILGLQINIKGGWHVYGNDSGGIGMPPSVGFIGSSNYKKHQISWPKAIVKEEKIGASTIKYSVYEDEVILPIEIILQDNTKPTQLKLKIHYGLCKDVCIPTTSDFVIDIENKEDEQSLKLIQKFFDKKIIFENTADKIAEKATEKPEKKVAAEYAAKKSQSVKSTAITLLPALLAAFLGGLILNIMPCVLPVLGIKLMSVIKCQESKTSRIRFAFFATTMGILSCFAIFAIFAIIIMLTGNIFDWGLQFQNPYFLILLIAILLGFVANMIGMFKITFDQFITNFINKKITEKESDEKNIFIPNFLSGILAVLLATPCSAPFLGSAISFSITQSSSIIILIFFTMGIGLALPYIILIISPKIVYLLPKPGNWMLGMKKLMTAFLAATITWLIYVLTNNIGIAAGVIVTIASALFFVCFKIKIKSFKIIAFTLLAITMIILPQTFQSVNKTHHSADKLWIQFSEEGLRALVANGQTVVVDVTADWCITCKFNKLRVFHDDTVVNHLRDNNIVAMRADITKPDEAVLTFIHKKGRYAIPFNAVYGPNAPDGLLTNELLNKKELFELIDKASTKK